MFSARRYTAPPCPACPACFQRVAEEFSATLSLHRQLASLVDVANGSLEEELLRDIEAYRQLLLMLLNQTRGAVTRESPLQQMAVNVSSTAAALEDSIAGFRANVSTAEAETERLRSVVEGQEQQLQLVELQVARLRQLLEGTLALQLRTAIMQHAELQAEVSARVDWFPAPPAQHAPGHAARPCSHPPWPPPSLFLSSCPCSLRPRSLPTAPHIPCSLMPGTSSCAAMLH